METNGFCFIEQKAGLGYINTKDTQQINQETRTTTKSFQSLRVLHIIRSSTLLRINSVDSLPNQVSQQLVNWPNNTFLNTLIKQTFGCRSGNATVTSFAWSNGNPQFVEHFEVSCWQYWNCMWGNAAKTDMESSEPQETWRMDCRRETNIYIGSGSTSALPKPRRVRGGQWTAGRYWRLNKQFYNLWGWN